MDRTSKLVLLVDDEEANRKLISRRLTNDGCRVIAVEGGLKALELLQSDSFDLVLLDLMMPGFDGLATLDAIRSNPQFDGIPVVMLTASNTRDSVVHCLSIGAADYLIKPVDPIQLKRRIERQLFGEDPTKVDEPG